MQFMYSASWTQHRMEKGGEGGKEEEKIGSISTFSHFTDEEIDSQKKYILWVTEAKENLNSDLSSSFCILCANYYIEFGKEKKTIFIFSS